MEVLKSSTTWQLFNEVVIAHNFTKKEIKSHVWIQAVKANFIDYLHKQKKLIHEYFCKRCENVITFMINHHLQIASLATYDKHLHCRFKSIHCGFHPTILTNTLHRINMPKLQIDGISKFILDGDHNVLYMSWDATYECQSMIKGHLYT